MANTGDSFTVILNQAQLEWGTHRYTNSRRVRIGEGYLKIPSPYMRTLNLYNNNGTNHSDVLGENLFNANRWIFFRTSSFTG
jgi:hypothetical protein